MSEATQYIQVGDQPVALPPGVTVAEWALERVTWQNPRLRAFLGCLQLLEGVLESNYAILHCSPERLTAIWNRVREVADLIRGRLAPLLRGKSRIPELEAARQSAEAALGMIDASVLVELDHYEDPIPPEDLVAIRKLLCVSIGQIHAFLQETFAKIMAGDPRSLHDADYFLSRRFPQDLEEAEWLHATVERLRDYLERLVAVRIPSLDEALNQMQRQRRVPEGRTWRELEDTLDELVDGLTPKLREVLALRGIRFDEMEIIDRYAAELPYQCRLAVETHRTALDLFDGLGDDVSASSAGGARALVAAQEVLSGRLAELIHRISKSLKDLTAFIPLWIGGIEKRRALLLKRGTEEGHGPRGASLRNQSPFDDGDPLPRVLLRRSDRSGS